MKPAALLILLACLPAAAVASGTVYKWVDGQGQMHFSQTPPPRGTFQELKPATSDDAPAAAAGAAPAATSAASQQEATRKFLMDAESADKAAAEVKAKNAQDLAERKKNCADARERADFLDTYTPRRLATENKDGTVSRMDEGEFNKKRDAAQKAIGTNCGP